MEAMMTKPSNVFVPGRFPVKPGNAWADRGEPQRRLITALERGFVPLVYGSYGVGKSSLVQFIAQSLRQKEKIIYIESVYGKSMSDVMTRVLETLGYEVIRSSTLSTESGSTIKAEATAEAGLFAAFRARLAGAIAKSAKAGEQQVRELAVTSPTDAAVIDLCERENLILILDELHQAGDEFRRDLAAFVKSVANRNCEHFRLCLLGTENDASALVLDDPGIDRILEEVALEPLTDGETKSIVNSGLDTLELSIADEALEQYVLSSVGSPSVAQYLGLEAAESAIKAARTEISVPDVSAAVKNYAERQAQRLVRAYRGAIETTGPRRYRQKILHAMAASDDEYVTMDQLCAHVSEQLEEKIPSTALSGPLRQLKAPAYGEVLRDVDRAGTGERVYNYSAFKNPGMKSVIRMIEKIGIE